MNKKLKYLLPTVIIIIIISAYYFLHKNSSKENIQINNVGNVNDNFVEKIKANIDKYINKIGKDIGYKDLKVSNFDFNSAVNIYILPAFNSKELKELKLSTFNDLKKELQNTKYVSCNIPIYINGESFLINIFPDFWDDNFMKNNNTELLYTYSSYNLGDKSSDGLINIINKELKKKNSDIKEAYVMSFGHRSYHHTMVVMKITDSKPYL